MPEEKQIVLSERLAVIARMIPAHSRVADVGTDHGYLPVWLVQNGAADRVIACDVREGPLEHARRSAEEYGVAQKLEFRLGDGLSCIAPGEADTVVIAGMGGETMISILESAPWVNAEPYRLLLQPMTKAELLRAYLAEHGYCFLDERLVCENHTYFPVMLVRGGGVPEALNPARCWGGVLLERDPLQGKALEAMIAQMGRALAGLERSALMRNAEKAAQLRPLIAQLQQMKEEWAHADHKRN